MRDMSGSTRRVVQFPAPREVEVVEESLRPPSKGEVRVRTVLSAISPGTERLVFTGNVPAETDADSSLSSLSSTLDFPVRYGYSVVGIVDRIGNGVDESWRGKRVFSFRPHVSEFVASTEELIPIPENVRSEDAVLIPNVETAVNLAMDGNPRVGERVVLFGQGIVGLLTTSLVSRYPLEVLITVDPLATRRHLSEDCGADRSVDPASGMDDLQRALGVTSRSIPEADGQYEGADLSYELSGAQSALNDAISVTGFTGRILVGSWYGDDDGSVKLGTRFHRSRIEIRSSQVSTIDPDHRGRWTKERRMRIVIDLLNDLRPGSLISHEYPQDEAPDAYRDLMNDEDVLQPVLRYSTE